MTSEAASGSGSARLRPQCRSGHSLGALVASAPRQKSPGAWLGSGALLWKNAGREASSKQHFDRDCTRRLGGRLQSPPASRHLGARGERGALRRPGTACAAEQHPELPQQQRRMAQHYAERRRLLNGRRIPACVREVGRRALAWGAETGSVHRLGERRNDPPAHRRAVGPQLRERRAYFGWLERNW